MKGETHSEDSYSFLHDGYRIFGALSVLYIEEFKESKMDKFIPDRKYTTIAFYEAISRKFSPNIRTENMVPSHPLSLVMK